MKTFPAGLLIKLTLPLIDHDGEPVVPTGVAFTVSDLDDVLLVPSTRLEFAENDTDAEVTVQAAFNTLAAGELSGGRIVRLHIGSASGTHVTEGVYGLRAYQRLVPPRNSFVTDAAAQVLAGDIPGLDGLVSAEAPERQAALIEAHTRICRIPLNAEPARRGGCGIVLNRTTWPTVTVEAFHLLPAELHRALFRAQLREADTILSGAGTDPRRAAGILSETIGDSSVTFQAGASAGSNLGLSAGTALVELTGFILNGAANPHSVEAIS